MAETNKELIQRVYNADKILIDARPVSGYWKKQIERKYKGLADLITLTETESNIRIKIKPDQWMMVERMRGKNDI